MEPPAARRFDRSPSSPSCWRAIRSAIRRAARCTSTAARRRCRRAGPDGPAPGLHRSARQLAARTPFESKLVERIDAMFAAEPVPTRRRVRRRLDEPRRLAIRELGRERPLHGLYVRGDGAVRRGPRIPSPHARPPRVAGHSSGGYGAMVCPMLRPEVFDAFAATPATACSRA